MFAIVGIGYHLKIPSDNRALDHESGRGGLRDAVEQNALEHRLDELANLTKSCKRIEKA